MAKRGFNQPSSPATRRETPAGSGPDYPFGGKRLVDIGEGTRLWTAFAAQFGFTPAEAAQTPGWRP